MSIPSVYTADQELKELIETLGFPVGMVEPPVIEDPEVPHFVLLPFPYSSSEGSMAGGNEIMELLWAVSTVGGDYEQARKAQVMLHGVLDADWSTMTGVMGPPRLSSGAMMREDERTFKANDLVTLKVSAV